MTAPLISTPVAVIGMACRFPEAEDYQAFWENLARGVNSIREVPPSRWVSDELTELDDEARRRCRWSGIVDGVDLFDHRFFAVTPRQARNMDPQQRLLLEEAFHCIEDSGHALRDLQQSTTSVFVGAMTSDYLQWMSADGMPIGVDAALGNYHSILANRISYCFGFSGQSAAVDTACSASLSALHEAVRSLQRGESDYAIVAGVNLNLHPFKFISFSKSRMMSPSGQSRTFDHQADGYTPGEGVGVLLLRPLADAITRGDHIHGVIRGISVGHSGRTQSITAPRVAAQREVIAAAYRDAGFSPRTVTYVEAHGTGTSLGDPIEVEALNQAFRQFTDETHYCGIGSVKSNIGHLEAAAGMAGVIKVLMMMKHRTLPKTLHVEAINPVIPFHDSPFFITRRSQAWEPKQPDLLLRAGVSAFGFGGTNAHVLLESVSSETKRKSEEEQSIGYPFLLSAKSRRSLSGMIRQWKDFTAGKDFDRHDFTDICMTMIAGRDVYRHRYGFWVNAKDDIDRQLSPAVFPPAVKSIPDCLWISGFNWKGWGDLHPQVHGDRLFLTYLDRVARILVGGGIDIPDDPDFRKTHWPKSRRIVYSLLVDYARISTLIETGYTPGLITGEGAGTWTALAVCGMVDLGELIAQRCPKGNAGKMAVNRPQLPFLDPISGKTIMPFLIDAGYLLSLVRDWPVDGVLLTHQIKQYRALISNQPTFKKSIEKWNQRLGPASMTLEGLMDDLERERSQTHGSGRKRLLLSLILEHALSRLHRKWDISPEAHSTDPRYQELLDLMLDRVMSENDLLGLVLQWDTDIAGIASRCHLNQGKIDTRKPYAHLRRKSRDLPEIDNIDDWLLKIETASLPPGLPGNSPCLVYGKPSPATKEASGGGETVSLTEPSLDAFSRALLELWLRGADIRWPERYEDRRFQRVVLPAYAFDGKSFRMPQPDGVHKPHPLPGRMAPELSLGQGAVFCRKLSEDAPLIRDHRVSGRSVFPAAGYLEIFLAAAALKGPQRYAISQAVMLQPLSLEEGPKEIRVTVTEDGMDLSIGVESRIADQTTPHAEGRLTPCVETAGSYVRISVEDVKSRCRLRFKSEPFYERLSAAGYGYGPFFKGIREISLGETEALATFVPADDGNRDDRQNRYIVHPALLDGALQAMAMMMALKETHTDFPLLPFAIDSVEMRKPPPARSFAYINASGRRRFHAVLLDERGDVWANLKDVRFRKQADPLSDCLYHPRWIPSPLPPLSNPGLSRSRPADTGTVLIVHPERCRGLETALAGAHKNSRVCFLQLDSHLNSTQRFEAELTGIDDIQTIYFLGGLQTENQDPGDLTVLESIQEQSVLSLFRLIKAICHLPAARKPIQLKVVTANLYRLEPGEQAFPGAGGLVGLTNSLAEEYPHWQVCRIDIGLEESKEPMPPEEMQPVIDAILAEPHGSRLAVAVRRGFRYIRELIPLSMPPAHEPIFRLNGVYMIVGGGGGIGLALSRYLAKTVQARLVLVGRRPTSTTQDDKIRDINSLGGEACYIQADAARPEEMQRAMSLAKSRFGCLHGAFHSALVLQDQLIVNLTEETFRAALTPKVAGSVVLYQVLKNEPLDFILFFSSALGLTGNAGQSNYTAGCSFQDSLADSIANRVPFPVKTINWGYWGSVGIVATEAYSRRLADQGIQPLKTKEGLAAIDRVLSNRLTPVAVVRAESGFLKKMGCNLENQIRLYPETIPRLPALNGEDIPLPPVGPVVLKTSRRAFAALERFCHTLLVSVFQNMGVFKSRSEKHVKTELLRSLGVQAGYHRLMDEFFRTLSRAGFIRVKGETLWGTEKLRAAANQNSPEILERKMNDLIRRFPEIGAHLRLLWACAAEYPNIFRGEVPATDIIFPNASMDRVKGVYAEHATADWYNRLAARALLGCIEARLPYLKAQEKIAILEVGAGTGGTTRFVLEAIAPYGDRLRYIYTDISQAFTRYGADHFGAGFPFMEFCTFDVEKKNPVLEIEPASVAVILATNVLHATRSIRQTLGNIKPFLSANGVLILNELTARHIFSTMTFGLLSGWWRFEDADIRLSGSPLLAQTVWQRILREEGWLEPRIFEQPEIEGRGAGQHLIVAQSDGIVNMPKKGRPEGRKTGRIFRQPAMAIAAGVSEDLPVTRSIPAAPSSNGRDDVSDFILRVIVGQIETLMGFEAHEIEMDVSFSDYGVDSITGTDLINTLNDRFQLHEPVTALFDYPTISDLCRHITEQHGPRIAGSFNLASARGIPDASRPVKTQEHPVESGGAVESGTGAADGIAVIGMACRLPGAATKEDFWHNLATGISTVGEIPRSRWNAASYYHPDSKRLDKISCNRGGFLDDIDRFDAMFFNISGKEAAHCDPQQRILLEESVKALEDAGYVGEELNRFKCGVFIGAGEGDYHNRLEAEQIPLEAQAFWGNAASVLPARLSYFLNLKGPSIAIDTACSSSLVAVHLGCQSLHAGESDMVIAGGVFVRTTPRFYLSASNAGLLSPEGTCFTFDDRADGFVPGEGVGVVILKPLNRALLDQDHIYGIIKGSGTNQDGKTNGITAPSAKSQTALALSVYQKAAINPETIDYVEAHGTGTKLGDPVEVNALTDAFREYTDRKQFCAIGSVKTNIGHTAMSAGIVGLIKVLLAFKHRKIPPTLNFRNPNKHIDFKSSPFYVNKELMEWPATRDQLRRATVSAFGMSGTNAHAVIEEPPPRQWESTAGRPCYIIPLSGKTESALKRRVADLWQWVETDGDRHRIGPISFTLLAGRAHYPHRAAFAAGSVAELKKVMVGVRSGHRISGFWRSSDIDTLFEQTSTPCPPGPTERADFQALAPDHYRERLSTLAKQYVCGDTPDWIPLYERGDCRRIPLPGYPFDDIRHSISPDAFTRPSTARINDLPGVGADMSENQVEQDLTEIVSSLLKIPGENIDSGSSLVEYGLDSLLAVDMAGLLEQRYGISVKSIELFEKGSIRRLTDLIIHEFFGNDPHETRTETGILEPEPDPARFPLSAGQQGLWLSHQKHPEHYTYNVPNAFRIVGKIDEQILQRTFKRLMQRHAMLRVSIRLEDGAPTNVVEPAPAFKICCERIDDESESGIEALLQERARIPFDLEKGPLFRVHLFSCPSPVQYLLVTLHHIVFDGKSIPLLFDDLTRLCAAAVTGDPVESDPTDAAYVDFVRWQMDMLGGQAGRNHREYWEQRLSGDLPILTLPYDRPRGPVYHPRGEHLQETIPGQMMARLKKTARQQGVSLFTLLLSGFLVLLHRYSQGAPDIVVGTPVAGRSDPVFETVMGHFANMTPIRVQIADSMPIAGFLQQAQKAVLEAVEHGDYPFIRMLGGVGETNTPLRSKLFQTAFVYLDWPDQHTAGTRADGTDAPGPGLSLERLPNLQQEEEFEITLKIYQRRDDSLLVVNYDASLFQLETIKRLSGHFRTLLDSIVLDPEQDIGEIEMLSPEEEHCLVKDFTATHTPYPRRQTIHQLFEEQARKSPDKIAIRCGERTVSYGELNTLGNRVANYLRQKGAGPETMVGVCMQRSIGMVASILGIIKAGGAYVPIDPDYPAARKITLMKDAGIGLLMTRADLLADLPEIEGLDLFCWDDPPDDMSRFSSGNIESRITAEHLAYMVYTSGSTGIPKGVAIRHEGVVRLVQETDYVDFRPEDRILQFAPLSFDASTFEIWGALLNGCQLHIDSRDKTALPELADFIFINRISIVWLTAGLFHLFVDHYPDAFKRVRLLLAGGDTLSPPHVKKFSASFPDCKLINGYGPTENTTFTTTFPVTPEAINRPSVPIGKPIANTRIYITDSNAGLVPQGIVGEILVGGAGLARGYWKRPDLTAEKFIPDPFGKIPGQRLYRTGDYGRWLPDGNIEFLGRMDEQVKIRGFRIELGEIETALSRYPGLSDVVVTAREDTPGDKRLAAYLTGSAEISPQALRAYLRALFPDYMIPSCYIRLESLPLTPNGKIDRNALPAPEPAADSGIETTPPYSLLEHRIVEIWKAVLGLDNFGVDDNFFDAGGNSLLIVEAYNSLLKEPMEREPKLVDLFRYPTIRSLARYLSSAPKDPTEKHAPKISSRHSNRRARKRIKSREK